MTLQEKVYELVKQVPSGKVTTYGSIGKALGTKGYRQIGQILHRNPDNSTVPCHRVVFADGSLSPQFGFGGIRAHKEKLEKEGVVLVQNKVVLLRHLFTGFNSVS